MKKRETNINDNGGIIIKNNSNLISNDVFEIRGKRILIKNNIATIPIPIYLRIILVFVSSYLEYVSIVLILIIYLVRNSKTLDIPNAPSACF